MMGTNARLFTAQSEAQPEAQPEAQRLGSRTFPSGAVMGAMQVEGDSSGVFVLVILVKTSDDADQRATKNTPATLTA
jgi:hypothetical protein